MDTLGNLQICGDIPVEEALALCGKQMFDLKDKQKSANHSSSFCGFNFVIGFRSRRSVTAVRFRYPQLLVFFAFYEISLGFPVPLT